MASAELEVFEKAKLLSREAPAEPTWDTPLSDVTVSLGDLAVELTCVAKELKTPRVTWLHDGREVCSGFHTRLHHVGQSTALMLKEVRERDVGNYTCVMEGANGRLETSCVLSVLGAERLEPPVFVRELHDMEVEDGDKLELVVEVKGTPPIEVFWFHNNVEITPDNPNFLLAALGHVHTLTLPRACSDCSGEYVCEAYNECGDTDTFCLLDVQEVESPESPSFDTYPPNLITYENEAVTFSCKVKGRPSPGLLWERGGVAISPSAKYKCTRIGEQHSLTIFEPEPSDCGEYLCHLHNPLGQTSHSFVLDVLPKVAPGLVNTASGTGATRSRIHQRRAVASKETSQVTSGADSSNPGANNELSERLRLRRAQLSQAKSLSRGVTSSAHAASPREGSPQGRSRRRGPQLRQTSRPNNEGVHSDSVRESFKPIDSFVQNDGTVTDFRSVLKPCSNPDASEGKENQSQLEKQTGAKISVLSKNNSVPELEFRIGLKPTNTKQTQSSKSVQDDKQEDNITDFRSVLRKQPVSTPKAAAGSSHEINTVDFRDVLAKNRHSQNAQQKENLVDSELRNLQLARSSRNVVGRGVDRNRLTMESFNNAGDKASPSYSSAKHENGSQTHREFTFKRSPSSAVNKLGLRSVNKSLDIILKDGDCREDGESSSSSSPRFTQAGSRWGRREYSPSSSTQPPLSRKENDRVPAIHQSTGIQLKTEEEESPGMPKENDVSCRSICTRLVDEEEDSSAAANNRRETNGLSNISRATGVQDIEGSHAHEDSGKGECEPPVKVRGETKLNISGVDSGLTRQTPDIKQSVKDMSRTSQNTISTVNTKFDNASVQDDNAENKKVATARTFLSSVLPQTSSECDDVFVTSSNRPEMSTSSSVDRTERLTSKESSTLRKHSPQNSKQTSPEKQLRFVSSSEDRTPANSVEMRNNSSFTSFKTATVRPKSAGVITGRSSSESPERTFKFPSTSTSVSSVHSTSSTEAPDDFRKVKLKKSPRNELQKSKYLSKSSESLFTDVKLKPVSKDKDTQKQSEFSSNSAGIKLKSKSSDLSTLSKITAVKEIPLKSTSTCKFPVTLKSVAKVSPRNGASKGSNREGISSTTTMSPRLKVLNNSNLDERNSPRISPRSTFGKGVEVKKLTSVSPRTVAKIDMNSNVKETTALHRTTLTKESNLEVKCSTSASPRTNIINDVGKNENGTKKLVNLRSTKDMTQQGSPSTGLAERKPLTKLKPPLPETSVSKPAISILAKLKHVQLGQSKTTSNSETGIPQSSSKKQANPKDIAATFEERSRQDTHGVQTKPTHVSPKANARPSTEKASSLVERIRQWKSGNSKAPARKLSEIGKSHSNSSLESEKFSHLDKMPSWIKQKAFKRGSLQLERLHGLSSSESRLSQTLPVMDRSYDQDSQKDSERLNLTSPCFYQRSSSAEYANDAGDADMAVHDRLKADCENNTAQGKRRDPGADEKDDASSPDAKPEWVNRKSVMNIEEQIKANSLSKTLPCDSKPDWAQIKSPREIPKLSGKDTGDIFIYESKFLSKVLGPRHQTGFNVSSQEGEQQQIGQNDPQERLRKHELPLQPGNIPKALESSSSSDGQTKADPDTSTAQVTLVSERLEPPVDTKSNVVNDESSVHPTPTNGTLVRIESSPVPNESPPDVTAPPPPSPAPESPQKTVISRPAWRSRRPQRHIPIYPINDNELSPRYEPFGPPAKDEPGASTTSSTPPTNNLSTPSTSTTTTTIKPTSFTSSSSISTNPTNMTSTPITATTSISATTTDSIPTTTSTAISLSTTLSATNSTTTTRAGSFTHQTHAYPMSSFNISTASISSCSSEASSSATNDSGYGRLSGISKTQEKEPIDTSLPSQSHISRNADTQNSTRQNSDISGGEKTILTPLDNERRETSDTVSEPCEKTLLESGSVQIKSNKTGDYVSDRIENKSETNKEIVAEVLPERKSGIKNEIQKSSHSSKIENVNLRNSGRINDTKTQTSVFSKRYGSTDSSKQQSAAGASDSTSGNIEKTNSSFASKFDSRSDKTETGGTGTKPSPLRAVDSEREHGTSGTDSNEATKSTATTFSSAKRTSNFHSIKSKFDNVENADSSRVTARQTEVREATRDDNKEGDINADAKRQTWRSKFMEKNRTSPTEAPAPDSKSQFWRSKVFENETKDRSSLGEPSEDSSKRQTWRSKFMEKEATKTRLSPNDASGDDTATGKGVARRPTDLDISTTWRGSRSRLKLSTALDDKKVEEVGQKRSGKMSSIDSGVSDTCDLSPTSSVTASTTSIDMTSSSSFSSSSSSTTATASTTTTSSSTNDSKMADVQQTCAPSFTADLSDFKVMYGSKAIFTCKMAGHPTPTVKWLLNQTPIEDSPAVTSVQSTTGQLDLRLSEVFDHHIGTYTCIASNCLGEAQTSCTLALDGSDKSEGRAFEGPVSLPPKVTTLTPKSVSLLRGSTLNLTSTFIGEPTPTVTWWKDERQIKPDGRVRIVTQAQTSLLTIESCCPKDAGRLSVRVTSSIGSDTLTMDICIEDVPASPIGQPHIYDVTAGSASVSWCGPPSTDNAGTQVAYYVIEAKTRHQKSWDVVVPQCKELSCHIHNLKPGTSYQFRVRAANKHGLGAPSDPTDRIITCDPFRSPLSEGSDDGTRNFDELPFEPRDVKIKSNEKFEDKYDVVKEVGKGKFGVVYKCKEKNAEVDTVWAAKILKCREKDKANIRQEMEVMNLLRHPKLLMLWDAFEEPRRMVLVMEYVGAGELFERVIGEDFVLTERDCVHFLRQICEGVSHMHDLNVLHLDLKPENILCVHENSNRIKIIDFGLARRFEKGQSLKVMFGTPEFIAPEVINYDEVGFGTDMWSVGVICYVLLSGLSPFLGDNDAETLSNVTSGDFDFDDEAFDEISDQARDFMSNLILMKKDERLLTQACLSHDWLSQDEVDGMRYKRLNTDRLRRFMVRRKWLKTGNAVLAVSRLMKSSLGSLGRSISRDSELSSPLSSPTTPRDDPFEDSPRLSGPATPTPGQGGDASKRDGPGNCVPSAGNFEKNASNNDVSCENSDSGAKRDDGASGCSNNKSYPDDSVDQNGNEPKSLITGSSTQMATGKNREAETSQSSSSNTRTDQSERAPEFAQPMKDCEAFAGDVVRFDVTLTGSSVPHVQWYFEDKPVSADGTHALENDPVRNTHSLIIRAISETDEGEYSCKAVNSCGDVTCSAELSILEL